MISIKQINEDLMMTGYQVKLDPDMEHTDKYVHIEYDGEFLAFSPNLISALYEIGCRMQRSPSFLADILCLL